MKWNKNLFSSLLAIVVFSVTALDAGNILNKRIEYINFKKIALADLFNYIGTKYDVNFVLEGSIQGKTMSVMMKNDSLKNLLKMVSNEKDLVYKVSGNRIILKTRKSYHKENYLDDNYVREKVIVSYASITDVTKFLQDIMPGQVVVRTSTENEPYENLFDATPKLAKPKSSSDSYNAIFPKPSPDISSGGQLNQLPKNKLGRYFGTTSDEKTMPTDIIYVIPFYNENYIYLLSNNRRLIRTAKKYICDVDVPIKEVLIQGKIIEISLDDTFTSFFEFNKRSKVLEYTSEMPQSVINMGNLQYSFLDSLLSTNVRILEDDGRAKTIASPMIHTANRAKATLNLTQDVSILTGWDPGKIQAVEGVQGGIVIPASPILSTQQVGTQLEIIPYINSENEILLKIKIDIADVIPGGQSLIVPDGLGGFENKSADSISTTSIDTTLITANNRGVVLGGLIRETISKKESKVPLLGDIPVLGIPFNNTEDIKRKTETIVILTPVIVNSRGPSEAEMLKRIRSNIDKNTHDFYAKEYADHKEKIDESGIKNLDNEIRELGCKANNLDCRLRKFLRGN